MALQGESGKKPLRDMQGSERKLKATRNGAGSEAPEVRYF